MKRPDKATQRWMRNASDEKAFANGCIFKPEWADHVLEFVESHLRLYEGDMAGQLVRLMDWQSEVLSRVFGWAKWSDFKKRHIRRFKRASVWVPKKNGKSPTCAMVGIYLLVADGEPGQKIFSAAKDGKQAKIVHDHARMMIEMDDTLSEECFVNKSTGAISHDKTHSTYTIMSSDNIKGQEGRNGSFVIDEAHVVDRRIADTLKYAGISRAEPLQFIASTAGDDMDGWGRSIQDYGRAVAKGDFENDGVFCEIYEAAQNATDEECCDPQMWKAANPALGYILDPAEFEADADEAKASEHDWAIFKKYRLNIWQHGTNPFLRMDDWAACSDAFTVDDLHDQLSFVGLDMSQTKDMTSAVFLFPQVDCTLQLPLFWMPEEEARRKNHLAPYLAWAKEGYLRLTPGDVIDFQCVEDDLVDLFRLFRVRELCYDKAYAEEITQRISMRTRVERYVFGQTMMNFTGPTAEYERRVINGTLKHNDNPILNWQAGHVEVKSDNNANRRPIKPQFNDHKKIDGIVAGIMALARVMVYESTGASVYDSRGLLTI